MQLRRRAWRLLVGLLGVTLMAGAVLLEQPAPKAQLGVLTSIFEQAGPQPPPG